MELKTIDVLEIDKDKIPEINEYAEYICNNPLALDYIDTIELLYDIIYSLSYKYYETKEAKYVLLLVELVKKSYISVDIRIFLLWQITRAKHTDLTGGLKKVLKGEEFESLSRDILGRFEKISRKRGYMNDERLVIITNQFITYDHSITKNILNIIKTINDKYPTIKEVYIYNGLEIPISVSCYYYKPVIFNYIEYSTEMFEEILQQARITRCGVGYAERNKEISIEKGIYELAREINQLNAKYVLSIGDNSILGALCNIHADVYTLTLDSEFPIGVTKYLVKWSNVKGIQLEEKNKQQSLITCPLELNCIDDVEEVKVRREDLKIAKEANLIAIVGNRLQDEIDKVFIDLLNNLCEQDKSIEILFIGKVSLKDIQEKGRIRYPKRVHFLGFCINLISTLRICKLFLNPDRNGGGYAGMAAMKAGIPIITMEHGDVANYLTSEFKVRNYEEMEEKILRLMKNGTYYIDLKQALNRLYEKNDFMLGENLLRYMING